MTTDAPVLRTVVEAATAEQAHRIALGQGAQFFGVPTEAIDARMVAASVKAVDIADTVLLCEVEYEIRPRIVVREVG